MHHIFTNFASVIKYCKIKYPQKIQFAHTALVNTTRTVGKCQIKMQ